MKAGRTAFTLVEMMVALMLVSLVTLGAGVLLSHGQRNWNNLYDRVYGAGAADGFLVQRVFDSICRKSSLRKCIIGEEGDFLEVYYWEEASTAETPENYGRLYLDGSELYAEHGKLTAGTWQADTQSEPTRLLIASEVEDLSFEMQDRALRMYLTYQDEKLLPVISSAVRHNE